jgi:uncharacterized iron-regulated protein
MISRWHAVLYIPLDAIPMRRIATTLGLMLALSGPAASQDSALPDFDSFTIAEAKQGTVSVEQAADALKGYDVIFIGELHDHIANHLAEMALLRALQARVPGVALSMEQFERDVQPVVNDYLAGRIGEETLKSKGRAWENYAEAYRPLVEYAKQHALPVIAANAPASLVRCVGLQGVEYLATLPAAKRGWAAAEIHTQDGPYRQKFLGFLSGDAAHGQAQKNETAQVAADRSFAAQATRDDTMAESIADYLQANPGHVVLHITGVFHVEDRLGTIERLRMRAPDLKIALILPVESNDLASPIAVKGANFAVLLKPEPQSYVTDDERKTAEAREAGSIRALARDGCK